MSRYVTGPVCSQEPALESTKGAFREFVTLFRESSSVGRRLFAMTIVCVAPEPPRDMEHVQMRKMFADPIQPVIQISRFEQRRIEALSIEADERASTCQLPGNRIEQRSFVAQPGQQVLASHERSTHLEAATPDQEGNGPGAATQPGGFNVDERL